VSGVSGIWAVVPLKHTTDAKQRLAGALGAPLRQRLALAMAHDVLAALAASEGLAGLAVVTLDPQASALARHFGARVLTEGAADGQTGAVNAAARTLSREGSGAMLTIPGDVPLITPQEVEQLIAAHDRRPDFVIAPAHDGRGSNAVLCAPPDAVRLKFGNDSFFPHLAAARALGLEPKIVQLAGIGLDIDHPRDVAAFMGITSQTRARTLLADARIMVR
jgi:2-phospho-L-lactate/phosphoenolpyruvate guanylyltransferase